MCRRNLFHYHLRVCTELQILPKTASRLWFYAYKKYKNGNSAKCMVKTAQIWNGPDQNGSNRLPKQPKFFYYIIMIDITAQVFSY